MFQLWSTCVGVACVLVAVGCSPKIKSGDETVVRVGDEKLSRAYLDQVEEMFRQNMTAMKPELALTGQAALIRKNAAREVIASRLMVAEAKKLNMVVGAEEIERSYTEFKERLGPVQLKEEIAAAGKTEESFREYLADGMLVDSLMKKILSAAPLVSDSQCRAFFDADPERFAVKGQIRISHIFFPAGESPAAAADSGRMVLAQLKSGRDFAELARKHSKGPSASSGGDMGWFGKGDILPEIEEAAFPLALNETSGLISSASGVHIVKKTGEKGEKQATFEDVREDIRARLEIENRMKTVGAFVDSLVRVSDVQYLDTSYAPGALVLSSDDPSEMPVIP